MASGVDSKPPQYKLIYFPAMGRGEAIRYIFAAGEVDYEEEVISMAEWPERKTSFTFHSIPVLEVTDRDGKHTISQTLTIARYLAKRFGLAGRTVLEQAKADMVVDGFNELWSGYGPYVRAVFSGADDDKKKEAAATFVENTFKPMLTKVQGILTENQQSQGKYFVGDRVTWADLYAAEWIGRVQRVLGEDVLDDHPIMKQFLKRIEAIPQIEQRIRDRPARPM